MQSAYKVLIRLGGSAHWYFYDSVVGPPVPAGLSTFARRAALPVFPAYCLQRKHCRDLFSHRFARSCLRPLSACLRRRPGFGGSVRTGESKRIANALDHILLSTGSPLGLLRSGDTFDFIGQNAGCTRRFLHMLFGYSSQFNLGVGCGLRYMMAIGNDCRTQWLCR